MKYLVELNNGLAGCNKIIGELDSEDYFSEGELPEDEGMDLLYDSAYNIAQEHVEVYLRPINADS